MSFMSRRVSMAAAALTLIVGGLVALPPAIRGQESEDLLVRVVAPTEAEKDAVDIPIEIRAEHAANLGAFSFQLSYDPDIVQVVTDTNNAPMIQRGDFLGSTGREVACNDPVFQPESGVLRLLCVTLRLEPDGPDGDGTLATINFRAVGPGTTDLALEDVRANNPDATEITPVGVQSARLTIKGDSGFNWAIWGPVIGIAAAAVIGIAAFAVMRARGGSGGTTAAA